MSFFCEAPSVRCYHSSIHIHLLINDIASVIIQFEADKVMFTITPHYSGWGWGCITLSAQKEYLRKMKLAFETRKTDTWENRKSTKDLDPEHRYEHTLHLALPSTEFKATLKKLISAIYGYQHGMPIEPHFFKHSNFLEHIDSLVDTIAPPKKNNCFALYKGGGADLSVVKQDIGAAVISNRPKRRNSC